MFQRQPISIIKNLYLEQPLDDSSNWDLDFFDREGYQLNTVEKEYHLKNEVELYIQDRIARRVSDSALNAVMQHWYLQKDNHPHIFIDHAHILHRFGFTGAALDQLIQKSKQHPKLQKMVNIKPKYGLDFAIDWIDDSQIVEVFHIELDCRDYNIFTNIVEKLQVFIETTNWEVKGAELLSRKSEWINLNEYEQSTYKAELYGLNKLGLEYFTEHYLNKPYLFSYLKVID